MTSPTTIGPEPQHLEGRSVRDIVEYSPEQVNEAWCRKIFRKTLQSLELQYAMHMPHRTITPDTIVFHENGEPLLIPSDDGPADGHEADDLNALARVVHYAITCELAPMGPLAGRVEGYSDSLVDAVDRCMDPDPARRPQTIAELRELLGIVPLGRSTGAAFPDDPLAPWPADVGAPDVPFGLAADRVPEAAPMRAHDVAPDLTGALPRDIAAEHTPDRALDAATDSAADLSRNLAVEHAHEPASDVTPATTAVPPPESAPTVAPFPASPAPAPAIVPDVDQPRRRIALTSRQRWTIAAGAAIVVALGAVMFAEMRDSGSFDHIVLTLPQQGDGTPVGQDAASAPPAPAPDATPANGPANGAAGSGTAGTTASSAGQAAPGAAPGTFITDDAPAAAPQQPATAVTAAEKPLPGVVVTPNGNLYKLHIQPWGVVYVDGVDRGVSPPVKRLVLTPGRHAIRITNPNFHDRVLEVDTANGDGRIHVDFNEAPR